MLPHIRYNTRLVVVDIYLLLADVKTHLTPTIQEEWRSMARIVRGMQLL